MPTPNIDQIVIDAMMEIKQDIGGIKESVDNLNERLAEHNDKDERALDKIDRRLEDLENTRKKFVWTFAGAWSVILAGVEVLRIWFHSS